MGFHFPNPADIANQAIHGAQHGIDDIRHQAENALRNVQHDAERGIRNVGHEITTALPQQAEAAIKDALVTTAEPVAKEAFALSIKTARGVHARLQALEKSHPDLVDAINAVSVSVTLSVVTLDYDNFYHRAEGWLNLMQKSHDNFHLSRKFIHDIITNSGPTSMSVNVSGELFTSAISAGAGVTVPTALIAELVDVALEKAGVPAE